MLKTTLLEQITFIIPIVPINELHEDGTITPKEKDLFND